MPSARHALPVAGCALLLVAAARSQAPEPPAWAEVRGVLESRCLPCHGGDEVNSGLRFSNAETFQRGGSRGPVLDADEPERSRILEVIRYGDPNLAMPPTGKLGDDEIAVLERWVRGGAVWPEDESGTLADPQRFPAEKARDATALLDWWAYRPLREVAVPAPGGAETAVHPIDAYLRARLADDGLRAAGSASPEVLLRRVTHDLTGLPPTPDERAQFLGAVERDGFEAAWQGLAERLLASPHYGEHQARHWLDLVRYAETNGYERDATKKNIWRYRDWVIRAFNADKPYDRFLIEQLAGDELATYAPELLDEPADSGPLLATGYYRLGVWDDEPADRTQARADELADIVDTTGIVFLGASVGCARCHDHKADPISQRDYYALTAYFNNVTGYEGGKPRDLADAPEEGRIRPEERAQRLAALDDKLAPYVTELQERAAAAGAPPIPRRLVADARDQPATWRYLFGQPPDGWQTPGFDATSWKEGPGGFGTRGTPGAQVGTVWTQERIQLRTRFGLTAIPQSLVLTLHHDEDVAVHLNGVSVFERKGHRTDYTAIQLDEAARDALVVGSNVLAVSCRQTGGGQYVDVGLRTGWLDDAGAGPVRLAAEAERWLTPERATQARQLLEERKHTAQLPVAEAYSALVVAERGRDAPPQHVLLRGSVHAPGDAVSPTVSVAFRAGGGSAPELPAPPEDAPTTGRRLALARWLVDAGRATTARVMANRLWQFHFGRGLCPTPGDFGRFGEPPTHPALLDHLALQLIAGSWSLKAMHRYILSSDAYRMASVGDPAAAAVDPRNTLYWRFPPRRLRAEEYRDSVLAVSGQLDTRMFGRSVYPPLPEEVLATASRPNAAWGKSSPEDAARRSVYVFSKRSLRVPLLDALDQPDPDLPCADRFPTNVPTQALMTLNGAFTRQAADALAARVQRDADSTEGRVARALELALCRAPRDGEVARHVAFLDRMRSQHGMQDDKALAVLCLALFNLNEFLWID